MATRAELVVAPKEGRLAFELGEGTGDCPYSPGDPLRAAWLRGFAAAREERAAADGEG
ncbi:Rmf/CrpP family protein [Streptomyces olivoreticuli]|uniref:ribosome modulation factor n=1 Tax=Streptomyces olivoreticuli TaxID=68246 RepID=UPI0013C3019C|nr:Rmf/CrpP family protein [Streptomyces olivoreticuli]